MALNVGSEATTLTREPCNAVREGFSRVAHQGYDFLWSTPTLKMLKKKGTLEHPPETFKIIHVLSSKTTGIPTC